MKIVQNNASVLQKNRTYWDAHADLWFGTTALPEYGVCFVTEEELGLFHNIAGKKVLEVCCGSGHSLKYLADRGAAELWGLDISRRQLDNAERYLHENGYAAKLLCTPMETAAGIPEDYFDVIYSIYGIGWTTDLDETFRKIASYLKRGGTFLFSWHHPLNYCVAWSKQLGNTFIGPDGLSFQRSYFDEEYFSFPVHDGEVTLCNRKVSAYINALAKAGFCVERMIEQTDEEILQQPKGRCDKIDKAQMLPLSMLFCARKL